MRWAKSYSIIDHEILHGGYLHRLSHESMILYLFLVIVADRDGRSFYADTTIEDILRLDNASVNNARIELLKEGLIYYQSPYWWIKNLKGGKTNGRRSKAKDTLSKRCNGTEFSPDPTNDRDFAKVCLKNISRILSKGQKEETLSFR